MVVKLGSLYKSYKNVKKLLATLLLFLSVYSLDAQNYIINYNKIIKQQQIDLLKKESVKKITLSSYINISNKIYHVSDKFITLDTISNVLNTIYREIDTQKTTTFTYNESNTLNKKIITTKKGRFKPKNNKDKYRYSQHSRKITLAYPKNRFYYTYDKKNRLIKKKSCRNNSSCDTEMTKYIGNKVYTSYLDEKGTLISTKMVEKKDTVKIELTTINPCKNLFKSVVFYDKNSLKLKEERFKDDILTYQEINTIENNCIVQTIQTKYIYVIKSKERELSIEGESYIYNKDGSLQTLIRISNNSASRFEYKYNEKGLLSTIDSYNDKKLKKSTLYEYQYF